MTHKKFAHIYDEFMNFVDYKSWYKFLKSFFKNKKLKVLDLGCGTGTLASMFSKDGHSVTAVDISDDMIEIAKNKYSELDIEFLKGDITKDTFGEEYDLIMCNFDTVNYFENLKEFQFFLKNAHKSLKKDGFFIFDIVEEGIFEEIFLNDLFIDETDKYLCIMRHEKYKKFKHLVEMTIFVKENENLYRKYTETHKKIIYDTELILDNLKNEGFILYDTARNSEYGESRLFLVCKK
ncbi:class I SAM-dependent methyltransferase [Streptobacillus felis]|uniref:Class I SAM-dependent methyltransferase n=1 Tax=Streptobacillus felis TaxID=1384509 RepID=A0A7Z0T7B0_9FUSO|nr:class I SAM-dependent methyltransferase [Streptobacillus felis]NYV28101.1 class I SAM-dependent methyltransferase [Streptobacillus felis]